MIAEQRDILLVPFPFSDQSGKKVRPVIVVSNDAFNGSSQDIIVCAMTTNVTKEFYTIRIEHDHLEEGNIREVCCIKVENILKLDKRLVIKKIDKLKESAFEQVKKKLGSLF